MNRGVESTVEGVDLVRPQKNQAPPKKEDPKKKKKALAQKEREEYEPKRKLKIKSPIETPLSQ